MAGCIKRGGLAAFLALLVVGGCVACLMPKIFWVETKSPVTAVAPIPGTNFTVNVTATIQRSLWQTCFKFNGTQSCEAIQKISFENVD